MPTQRRPDHASSYTLSTNLINWSLLATLTNPTGTVLYTDTESTNLPRRFYKAVQLPKRGHPLAGTYHTPAVGGASKHGG